MHHDHGWKLPQHAKQNYFDIYLKPELNEVLSHSQTLNQPIESIMPQSHLKCKTSLQS